MIEMCKGCGRPVLVHRIANLVVKCEPVALDGSGAVAEIMAGGSLWMVERNLQGQPVRLRGARPGEPGPVPEHRCLNAQEALSRPRTPSVVPSPQPTPQRPPAGRTAPSSGPSAAPSSVRTAASPAFKIDWSKVGEPSGPRCDGCSQPCADGTYASIALGELTVWAHHVNSCDS